MITNSGAAPAADFWVDFYIQPASARTGANHPWDTRCALTPCSGLVWHFLGTLAPGQSVTLRSTSLSYEAAYTRWPGYFTAGARDLYLYVDSWSADGASAGAVAESDEANNRAAQLGAGP